MRIGKKGWEGDHLGEIPDRIHSLGKPLLGGPLGPQVRLSVRLREDARRANEVPRAQGETCIAVVLLRGNVLRKE